MRRHAAVLAALLVGLAVVVAPATPAAAHTKLSKAVPAARSTVTTPVTALSLTFSGLVKQAGSEVTVRGADGAEYQEAQPRAVDKTITQRVRALPVGQVTVAWKTVSGDGHPISGSYTFTNTVAPPVPTASPTTDPVAEPTSVPTPDVVPPVAVIPGGGTSKTTAAWAAGGGAVVVAGLVVLLLLRRRRRT